MREVKTNQDRIMEEQTGEQIESEPSRHKKIVQTVFISATYFMFGILRGQEGVVFLDLILITNSDISSGSLMFTANAFGYILGLLLIGTLFDKFNNDIIYCTCVVMTGIATLIMPWCTSLILMIAVYGIRSFFMGPADSGTSVICAKTWLLQAGPFLQMEMFLFAVGGIIAPFITEPFLLKRQRQNTTEPGGVILGTINETNTTGSSSDPHVFTQPVYPMTQNFSETFSEFATPSPASDQQTTSPSTQVYIAFFISGGLILCVCFAFVVKIIVYSSGEFDRFKKKTSQPEKTTEYVYLNPLSSFPFLPKLTCFVLVAVYCFSYACVEKILMSFLMTFTVEHLGWSKTDGSLVTTVFWSGFAAGRFLGIFLVKLLKPHTLIFVDLVSLLVTFVAMFLVERLGWSEGAWWVLIGMSALFFASIFATFVTWLSIALTPVTGKLLTYVFVWNFIGMMSHMALLGYLFEAFSPMWFVYLLIIHTVLLIVTQVALCVLVKWFRGLYCSGKVSFCSGADPKSPEKSESDRKGSGDLHTEAARLLQTANSQS